MTSMDWDLAQRGKFLVDKRGKELTDVKIKWNEFDGKLCKSSRCSKLGTPRTSGAG